MRILKAGKRRDELLNFVDPLHEMVGDEWDSPDSGAKELEAGSAFRADAQNCCIFCWVDVATPDGGFGPREMKAARRSLLSDYVSGYLS